MYRNPSANVRFPANPIISGRDHEGLFSVEPSRLGTVWRTAGIGAEQSILVMRNNGEIAPEPAVRLPMD
jgi:hypothetical protein